MKKRKFISFLIAKGEQAVTIPVDSIKHIQRYKESGSGRETLYRVRVKAGDDTWVRYFADEADQISFFNELNSML